MSPIGAVDEGLVVDQQAGELAGAGNARECCGAGVGGDGQRGDDSGERLWRVDMTCGDPIGFAGMDGDGDVALGEVGAQRGRIGPAAIDAAEAAEHTRGVGAFRVEGCGHQGGEGGLDVGLVGHAGVPSEPGIREPAGR